MTFRDRRVWSFSCTFSNFHFLVGRWLGRRGLPAARSVVQILTRSGQKGNVVANKRKIIVHIATSADGYIARPDGDLEWLTKRPAPKGFYGIGKFMNSIDTKLLGRKTYDLSVQMGAPFGTKTPHYVFSRRPAPASLPAGVAFVSEAIGAFAKRLRTGDGQGQGHLDDGWRRDHRFFP